jgi:sensor domain CHASE-containing protein
MVSKPFSFRLPDEAVQVLESRRLDDETLNQAAQRVLLEALNVNTSVNATVNADLSTTVDIQEMIKQQVEASLIEVRSQLDELRGKLKAR